MQRKKVIVGMSGGVDSSVSALLLKNEGYRVEGLFMKNWHDKAGIKSKNCPHEEDFLYAELVCKKLNIPLHNVDLSKYYRKRVVNYMFNEYRKGNTPNPDILCNREIKFDVFLKEAFRYDTDYIATGHYCRLGRSEKDDTMQLLSGVDKNKDQSYFLCQLSQNQLRNILFPIGHLRKHQVRQIATEYNLPTANRKDSQGICFIGKVDLPTFLKQQLTPKKGIVIEIDKNIIDIEINKGNFSYNYYPEMGKEIGTHQGAYYYTIGQRKGINIGGKSKPLYVLHTDVKNNILYVGQGHEHPLLQRDKLIIKNCDIHWLCEKKKAEIGEKRNYLTRIRYRQKLQKAKFNFTKKDLIISFEKPQRAITPGQFAVWYEGEELIGSGAIA